MAAERNRGVVAAARWQRPCGPLEDPASPGTAHCTRVRHIRRQRLFCADRLRADYQRVSKRRIHELRDRGSIIREGSEPPFASHDIENVSLQWNQSTEGFASPRAIWTATALKVRQGLNMSPRDSSLRCMNIGDDKLLGMYGFRWLCYLSDPV